jgi:exosome complex RNA-binding protein Rrp42 (RNase PH superfamily)
MRLDGRGLFDWRKLAFHFSPTDDASCTLVMGTTRILSSVSASLESPYPERPAEGNVRFNVEFSPMASPMFEPGRPGEEAIEVARLVDRALRGSRAIDQEALCVLAGRKVWSLRVDIHVLDHGGNLVDACCLSALGALMAFRKPETSVETGADGTMEVLVHPSEVKEPLPLTLHHLPVAVTYALFEGGNTVVVDPSLREEMAMQGCLTLIVNSSKEVCAVHKAGGVGVVSGQIMRCIRLAFEKVEVIIGALKAALETHAVKRVAARVKRHRQVQGFEPPVTAPLVQKETKVASTLQKLGIDAMDFDDEDVDNEEERMKDVSVPTALDPPPESERAPASSGKKPAKLRPPAQQPSPGGNKVATSSKRPAKRERGEVGLEGMESIAKAIAGVGKGEKEITSLSEAIKKKPTEK